MTDGLALLLRACEAVNLPVTAEDIADAAWLAQWRTVEPEPGPEAEPEPEPEFEPEPEPARASTDAPPRPVTPDPITDPDPLLPPEDSRGESEPSRSEGVPSDPAAAPPIAVSLPPVGKGNRAGRSLGVPTPPALPHSRALGRALRPLVRRAPSRTRFVLDVDETIRRLDEQRVLLPVLRPARERWLRLILVADGGAGADLWRETVLAFRAVLTNLGAFRDVWVWNLDADGPQPRVAPWGAGRAARHPDELTDPQGRTLTVVMSAFVAPGWRDGSVAKVLNRWAEYGAVVLVPLLPERLWARTAIGALPPVRVAVTRPGFASTRVRYARARGGWVPQDIRNRDPAGSDEVALPLAVLEPDALWQWATVLAGHPGATAPGVLFPLGVPPRPVSGPAPTAPSADERVRRFCLTASPLARRLAVLLAASPVSLSVMRLIRVTQLPEAGPAHEAEVLFGGLLQRTGDRAADDPRFEFFRGVRDLLLDAARPDDSLAVLKAVSRYLGAHFADGRAFKTVLDDPKAAPGALSADPSAEDVPFARIAAEVLARAGGAYARLARALAPAVLPPFDPNHGRWPPEAASGAEAAPFPYAFGPYELIGVIGRGRMSVVYRARSRAGGPDVALKTPSHDIAGVALVREWFHREYQTLARLRHRGIVPVIEFGQHDSLLYFTMPLVAGARLDSARRTPAEAARVVAGVADALQHAHGAGVIHTDLKPGHVVVREDGEPVVVGFGRALVLGRTAGGEPPPAERRWPRSEAVAARLTDLANEMGAPGYLPPEQWRDDPAAVGPWSDVFALGAVLYELLTGRPPFIGSVPELMELIRSAAPVVPPVERVPDLDPQLNAITVRALAKEPAGRWASMTEFGAALRAYAARAGTGIEPTPPVVTRSAAALVIGVGYYAHTGIAPLRYAADDAEAVAKKLADPSLCQFPADRVRLLTDRAATRDAIVAHLSDWLPAVARGAELVFIYFVGHSLARAAGCEADGYLLPHDAHPSTAAARGIALADLARWADEIGARAVAVCLDCCYPGLVPARGRFSGSGIAPDALRKLVGPERYIITSCAAGQTSVEDDDEQHGLFAHCLLKGIDGAGDHDGDGRVGLAELLGYVADQAVPQAARRLEEKQQPWAMAPKNSKLYLSVARVRPVRAARSVERTSEEVARLLRAGPGESETVDLLRQAGRLADPTLAGVVVPLLAPRGSKSVRQGAAAALRAIGVRAVFDEIETLARRADPALGAVLDGLATVHAREDLVALLSKLVDLTSGEVRTKTAALLDRTRLGLDLTARAELLRKKDARYELRRGLRQGSITTVYLARDTGSNRDVIVVLLRDEFARDPETRQRFIDVRRQAAALTHPNLVRTLAVGAFPEDGLYYSVRAFVPGAVLRDVLARVPDVPGRRFSPAQVGRIAYSLLQVLAELAKVGPNGMYHGAVRMSNIYLTTDDRLVLGDFSPPNVPGSLASEGWADDAPWYATAPEVLRGECGEPPADLYSLACVVYELLCGVPPFVGGPHEVPAAQSTGPAPPVSARRSDLGPEVDAFVARLLSRNPVDRGTAAEALRALSELRLPDRPA